MNWGALRVWNDDTIEPQTGFPTHPHRNMEIITYVRKGAITHKDNLGNVGRTEAGDVQVMSAGSGVAHSEYNLEPSATQIFQIWILPTRTGEPPRWGARPFPKGERAGRFVTLASGFANDDDALPIRADARVVGATLKAGETAEYHAGKGPAPLSRSGDRRGRDRRSARQRPRRRRDQGRRDAHGDGGRGQRDRPRRRRLSLDPKVTASVSLWRNRRRKPGPPPFFG